MLRVLIADDEIKIIQLIEHLIDWKKLKMQVVARAENGIEALELVQSTKPEIIITDIRMPGYDGLEFIKRVRELQPEIAFIIISGYRHFEYAQTAIRFGVSDYLLKPIKRDELFQTLQKIADKLNIERGESTDHSKDDIKHLRRIFLRDILYGLRQEEEKAYHFQFQTGEYAMVIVKLDGKLLEEKQNLKFILEKARVEIMERIKRVSYESESYNMGTSVYLLLNYAPEDRGVIYKQLRNFLDGMVAKEHIWEGLRTTIAYGRGVRELSDIASSLRNARMLVEERILSGTLKIYEGEARGNGTFVESEIFSGFNREIIKAMEMLEIKRVREVLTLLKHQILSDRNITAHEIIQMTKEACNQILIFARKNRIFLGENIIEQFSAKIERCATAMEVLESMVEELVAYYTIVVEQKRQEDYRPIRLVKQYIRENYSRAITLEEASEIAGLSPTYLSNVFKKETGKTFLEYIQEIRMEKAKELLKHTCDTVSIISEKVGYSDVRYFTKTFIKSTGLKPNEYRKIYA